MDFFRPNTARPRSFSRTPCSSPLSGPSSETVSSRRRGLDVHVARQFVVIFVIRHSSARTRVRTRPHARCIRHVVGRLSDARTRLPAVAAFRTALRIRGAYDFRAYGPRIKNKNTGNRSVDFLWAALVEYLNGRGAGVFPPGHRTTGHRVYRRNVRAEQ